VWLSILLLGCVSEDSKTDDWLTVNAEVIYPKIRIWTTPAASEEANVNSPSLQWPADKKATYDIRLSTSRDFSTDLIQEEEIPFAIFNPHQPLKPGKWFWQYRVKEGDWNEIDSFMITASTPEFVPPPFSTLSANIPREHPRVLVRKTDLEAFVDKAKNYLEAEAIIREASDWVGKKPPKEIAALPTYTGKDDFENKKIALLASKWVGWNLYKTLDLLSQAYILSGDQKFFNTAREWMMEASSWDPKGPTHTNNFGDSGVMAGLALGVDTFWDLLSVGERQQIIKQVAERANHFYDLWISQVESRSSSMHVWQHILHRMFYTSLALVGEVPEAEKWLEYIYEIWIAQAPKMGEQDGAWFNGTGYFSMNTLTLYEVSATLKELSDVDFMQSDWYRNNPRWLIYAFPPGSVGDGFCNNGDRLSQPAINYAGYADAASRVIGDPYATWYASEVSKNLGLTINDDYEFRWFRIQRGYQFPLPGTIEKFDLPQAAVFPEVGVAYMHTTIEDPRKNLMLAVRSSPYGPMAHTHADQNTFNMAYGGKRLFYNSGYRPAMGDPHFLGWYKHTQGHNGILIDGKGQPFDAAAYGWLPRFLHGKRLSYVVGDASKAYSGIKEDKQDHGLKHFRRHYLMLRPATIIIYDELEADHAAEWSWLLHNDLGFEIEGNSVSAQNSATKAKVSFYTSTPVDFKLTNQFSVPVENWTNKVDEDGDTLTYANQWHFSAVSKEKAEKMRFLTIFQISPEGNFEPVVIHARDYYSIGDWEIRAEMDTTRTAGIFITHMDGAVAFSSRGALTTKEKAYSELNSGSAKLLEDINGKMVFQESKDRIPAAIQRVLDAGRGIDQKQF
tara:strand:- start:30519 stop:33047 length:2529 start_codon:yes stop_codon:yes gene_type:complete